MGLWVFAAQPGQAREDRGHAWWNRHIHNSQEMGGLGERVGEAGGR